MSNSIPKRNRNIHSWSIRGINSQEKWDAIWSKIMESNYDVVGLRKTKTLLMLSILENSAPQDLIVLNSWVTQEEVLLSGKAESFQGKQFFRMILPKMWNFIALLPELVGF